MQGVQARERDPGVCEQVREERHGLRVPPLIQQPRRRVALPPVRVRERGDQLGGLGLAELRGFGSLEVRRHDAVNAPAIVGVPPVRDVERAVGAVDDLHRAKAGVRRNHELGVRFVHRPRGGDRPARLRAARRGE